MRPGKCYFLYIAIFTLAIGAFFGTGCKKFDGIDNNKVVRTPYGLYFSDNLGSLYNTNDGKAFKFVFPGDGVASRTLVVSGDNIIIAKYNVKLFPDATVFVSADAGLNFNPRAYSGAPNAVWQSMMLDVPSHDRVYLASTKGQGVEFSQDHGVTWEPDISFESPGPTTIESFAQLNNGKLYALDNNGPHIYERATKVAQWKEVTMTTALPNGGRYYLAHFNDALIAASYNGGGVYSSTDGGVTWVQYGGIPSGQKILSAGGPLDQVLLAGTDSAGIYRLVGDSFQPSNNGLLQNTSVYSIVGKQETFKNNVVRQFVYIATSKGLYRSEDLGKNWTAVRPGDMRLAY